MKNFNLIKRFVCSLLILISSSYLLAEQIEVTVTARSTQPEGGIENALLKSYTAEQIKEITDLKVKSEAGVYISTADFAFLNAMPKLSSLDLSGSLVASTDTKTDNMIPGNVFLNNKTIKVIILPELIEAIGNGAFSKTALEGEIILPSTLKDGNVANSRFANTQGISGFTSNNTTNTSGIKTIKGVVFNFWGTLLQLYPCGKTDEEYTIPNPEKTTDMVMIMNSAFGDNQYLKKLTISSQTTKIQSTGRYDLIAPNSNNLEAIYVDAQNPIWGSIDGKLFYEKETKKLVLFPPKFNPESITVDGSKIEIVGTSFSKLTNLKNLIFTEGVKEIGKQVFQNLTTLESVDFPASLTTIGGNAFENSSIKAALFKGNNLSVIPGLAFKNTKLERIDLPASITSIQNEALNGNTNLDLFICRAENVPEIWPTTFNAVGWRNNKANTKVYVPAKSLELYKNSNWIDGTKEGDKTYKGFPVGNFFAFYNITLAAATAQSTIANDIAPESDVVTVTANEAPAGMKFDKWTSTTEGVVFADAASPTTTFTMPAKDVEITATYKGTDGMENTGTTKDAVFVGKWNEATFNAFILANAANLTTIDLTGVTELTQVPVTANLNPNCLIYVSSGVIGNIDQNIISFDGSAYTGNVTLAEATDAVRNNSFNNKHAFTGNISYTRNFSNAQGKFATICLPFVPTNPSELTGLEFEEFDKVTVDAEQANLNFNTIEANALQANTPYIVKIAPETTTVTFKGASVAETNLANPPASEGYTFNGNYCYNNAVTSYYLLRADGSEFAKGSDTSYITAFRAYLTTTGSDNRKLTVGYNGGATGLEAQQINGLNIYSEDGIIYINTGNAQVINIYSLDGRIVKTTQLNTGNNTITGLAKGIYLINQQKVANK